MSAAAREARGIRQATGPAKPASPLKPSSAELKGRRAAVPPPKRILAEGETGASATDNSATAGESDRRRSILRNRLRAERAVVPTWRRANTPRATVLATNNKLIWIVCGSIAAPCLSQWESWRLTGALSGAAVVEKPPAGPSLLVLDWPKDERGGAIMTLDDVDREVSQERRFVGIPRGSRASRISSICSDSGPLRSTSRFRRKTEGARYTYKPEWKPARRTALRRRVGRHRCRRQRSDRVDQRRQAGRREPARLEELADRSRGRQEGGRQGEERHSAGLLRRRSPRLVLQARQGGAADARLPQIRRREIHARAAGSQGEVVRGRDARGEAGRPVSNHRLSDARARRRRRPGLRLQPTWIPSRRTMSRNSRKTCAPRERDKLLAATNTGNRRREAHGGRRVSPLARQARFAPFLRAADPANGSNWPNESIRTTRKVKTRRSSSPIGSSASTRPRS